MIVGAIDPGSAHSAIVVLERGMPTVGVKLANDELLGLLRRDDPRRPAGVFGADVVVIEWTAPRGMPASAQLFETLWWAGRFAEALYPCEVERLERAVVKRHLCATSAAKDANVRQALIDRYGGARGKEAAIGRKASPGPLYGIRADVWAALAVAVTWADGIRS